MTQSAKERVSVDESDAEAAGNSNRDKSASETVPADEETEGATNALEAPAALPEMAQD